MGFWETRGEYGNGKRGERLSMEANGTYKDCVLLIHVILSLPIKSLQRSISQVSLLALANRRLLITKVIL